ncbi:MAG: iron-containing redox enzyme family protein [Alphaproteobacteria bacterium]|nr:iron-containing redox enzyme family protein [Alphaproteobacteria bacterium]
MVRTPEQFEEAMLDLLQEARYRTPSYLEEFNRNHLCREGAWVYALEHCVFGANFPRWLANIAGNCPVLEVRKYLIENLYVEEVNDPTITIGHHESLVDFAVALGIDRDYVMNYTGAPITKIRAEYFEHVSRTKPWLVAFAAVCSGEMTRGTKMFKRVGERATTSRSMWAPLNLSDTDLAHWDAAEVADCGEDGHGDMPYELLKKYATTQKQQDACLAAMREFQAMTRIWADQVGVWAFEAAGLEPPPLTGRQPLPTPKRARTRAA